MRRIALIGAATGCLLLPGVAEARSYGVPCRSSTAAIIFKTKPRNCTLGGRYSYQQAPVRRIRWRNWGGYSSYARGTLVAMGYRFPVRFKVYRPRFCEGDFYVYTRARGTTYRGRMGDLRWRMRLRWRC